MDWLTKFRLQSVLRRLTGRGVIENDLVEVVPCSGGYFATIAPHESDPVICDESVTGFSNNPETALLKAMSERVERLAFRTGKSRNIRSCQTARSDGFAAFPLALKSFSSAKRHARRRALGEATERFVWAKWWDDERVGAQQSSALDLTTKCRSAKSLLEGLETPHEIREIKAIRPYVDGGGEVMILVCEMTNGGFLSGGASGGISEEGETLTRAAAELFRHGLASKRLLQLKLAPQGFYQERLSYFALGPGGSSVKKRLNVRENEKVILPSLSIDEEIPHEYADTVYVHRCLFEGQPPFIGGSLERFCI